MCNSLSVKYAMLQCRVLVARRQIFTVQREKLYIQVLCTAWYHHSLELPGWVCCWFSFWYMTIILLYASMPVG